MEFLTRPIERRLWPRDKTTADPPYWLVDFHLNLRGHALVAEALKPVVDALLGE